MSGSLDPFKPFHRRFVRLHNAATLIKINYTLASVRSFIRHIPTILARRRFFILAPPLFLHRTFDHQPPGSERHRLGNHPLPPFPLFSFFIPPLAPPLARLFALYSRFNLPTSGRQARWCALDSVMGLKKKKRSQREEGEKASVNRVSVANSHDQRERRVGKIVHDQTANELQEK